MTGTTAGNPLDRPSDTSPGPLAAAPPAADVEVELQRIARRRLAPPSEAVMASNSHRISSRRPSIVGGFDSPEGFAFGSD